MRRTAKELLLDAAMRERNEYFRLTDGAFAALSNLAATARGNADMLSEVDALLDLLCEPPSISSIRLAKEDLSRIHRLPGCETGLLEALAIFCAGEHLKQRHTRLGYPSDMIYDEVSDLRVWMDDYHERHGAWGLSEFTWVSGHFTGRLFSLGRLQYEWSTWESEALTVRSKRSGDELTLLPGDRVIGLHIPKLGPLTPQTCGDSARRAVAFFAEHFPSDPPKAVFCGSWLLDKHYETILPPTSNIRLFLRPFIIYKQSEVDSAMWDRVFGQRPESLKSAPRDTTLRRAVLDHYASGGKLGSGYGVIPWADLGFWEEL